MGNGAKAQMKRERNDKTAKGGVSQLKVNQQALSIQCAICRQSFLQTIKRPDLQLHLQKVIYSYQALQNDL